MPNALSEALRTEIDRKDAVHENLEILDTLLHELLEMTAPLHDESDDCHCGEGKEVHAAHIDRNKQLQGPSR
jgi:hypothetical protein